MLRILLGKGRNGRIMINGTYVVSGCFDQEALNNHKVLYTTDITGVIICRENNIWGTTSDRFGSAVVAGAIIGGNLWFLKMYFRSVQNWSGSQVPIPRINLRQIFQYQLKRDGEDDTGWVGRWNTWGELDDAPDGKVILSFRPQTEEEKLTPFPLPKDRRLFFVPGNTGSFPLSTDPCTKIIFTSNADRYYEGGLSTLVEGHRLVEFDWYATPDFVDLEEYFKQHPLC